MRIISAAQNFCKFVALKFHDFCCKIRLSLSDPGAVVSGKGVRTMRRFRKRATKKRVKEIVKKIVEGVIGRFIYDVLKHLFKDDD